MAKLEEYICWIDGGHAPILDDEDGSWTCQLCGYRGKHEFEPKDL